MDNKTKVDRLNDIIPAHFQPKSNPNWKAVLGAIGEQDEVLAQLVAQVREQFFVKTAIRPYLDRLAANNNISRPAFVGMQDSDFRTYIPVLSYKPKQVKQIIDSLLDIFFFKESTTAFITSQLAAPFALQDGWGLEYSADELNNERINFSTSDFTDITHATANEVVATINRQAKYSYATAEFDSITKNTYIRLFTNTVGSKGSLRITGGAANVALHFNGFIETAGNGFDTQWTVTKVGDQVTFTNTGGTSPGINQLQAGDIIIISNIPNNNGSFEINSVDVANNAITFTNLFGGPGVYTQTSETDTKFVRPQKYVAYTNANRAITWEVSSGEVIVEMPTSPPVVKRSLQGSYHINGVTGQMINRVSDTALTLQDASLFPLAGNFWLQELQEIDSHWLTPSESTFNSVTSGTRLSYGMTKYSYATRDVLDTTGDTVAGSSTMTNLASVVGLAVGDTVFSNAVVYGTTVLQVLGNTISMSHPALVDTVNGSVSFGSPTLTGINPPLPEAAGLNEFALTSLTRSSNVVTGITVTPHNYHVGDAVIISGSSGILDATTTGDTMSGNTLITNIASMSGIAPGQVVSGPGIVTGTVITDILGNTATMSQAATATATGVTLMFSENLNGSFVVTSASGSNFTYNAVGANGTASTPGTARVERIGLSNSGSIVILTGSLPNFNSRLTGAYMWDTRAPFVLSSNTATTLDTIQAGKIVRLLNVTPNTIPAGGGYLIFDYGQNTQEGPVRYLYAPTNSTVAIDPSYVFQFSHSIGSGVVSLSQKGPHTMTGKEYAPYITDPSQARAILQELIRSVTSAGIFVDFLIRFPEQLYGTLDVYNQFGNGAGAPFPS